MRTISLVFAAICCLLAALGFYEVSFVGFPDRYVSEYGKAAMIPLEVLSSAFAILSFCFLGLARLTLGAKFRRIGFTLILGLTILMLGIEWFGVPWYFQDLNHGQGG